MNKADLLTQIRASRQQLEATLAQISDEQMVAADMPGGWSAKDALAHIAWWEKYAVNTYHTLRRGDTPASVIEEQTVDELNARVFAENRARNLADVRREESEVYQDLLALVENAPEEDLFNPQQFAWTEGQPFVDWIKNNTYGHYEEHLDDLRALKKTS